MPNQQPNLEKKTKFNLKYILIVAILATIVGGGILAYQYWWLPKQEAKQTELTPIDETADWKTYRNEEYGFEFKYPLSFELLAPGQPLLGNEVELGYFSSENGQLSITVEDQKLDPMNIYGIYGKKNPDDLKTLIAGGKTAYMYTEADAGCGVDVVNIPLNNSTLKLSFSYCGEENIENYKNQILSTFRFLE